MTETVQAVDTPAPDANASPEIEAPDGADKPKGSEAAPSPAVTDTDEIANKAKGVGKRIDELTRNWRETERDRDYWREVALRNQQQPQQQPAPQSDRIKTLADFEYDEGKYAAYVREQTRNDAVEAARKELQAEREKEEAHRRRASFQSRESDFAKTVEDYYEATRDNRVPISNAMVEAIAESEDGPALAYHLAKNLDVAARIASLPPLAAAREIGRIEAKLAVERDKAKSKPAVSQAPPPPPKIEAVEASVSKDPSEMTDAEFAKWRRKQIAARGGR